MDANYGPACQQWSQDLLAGRSRRQRLAQEVHGRLQESSRLPHAHLRPRSCVPEIGRRYGWLSCESAALTTR